MIVFAFILYGLLAWLRPRLALGVLLCLIPFGHLVRFSIAGVPFTFPEVAAYVSVAALVLQRLFALPLKLPLLGGGEKKKWFLDPWTVLPLLWIIIAAVSAAYSPNALRAWGMWKAYVLVPVVLFFVIRYLSRSAAASIGRNKELRIKNDGVETDSQTSPMIHDSLFIILSIAAGAAIVAAIAIVQRWWPIGVPYPWSLAGKFRATSVFGYPNAVGLYLAPLVPILVGAAFSSFRSLRAAAKQSQPLRGARLPRSPAGSLAMTIVFGLSTLLSIVAIWFAKSTGALVALVVALPTFLFLAWCARYKKAGHTDSYDRENRCAARGGVVSAAILVAWIAASLIVTAWLPYRHEQPTWGPPIVQKLTFQKWSGSVRLAQYRETWKLLRDHSIRGAGLAGYQQAIAPYHEDAHVEIFLYPHNLLLAVWVELGLAGVLVFLAMLYQFFRRAFTIHQSPITSAAMLVILVHGLVDVPYFKNDLAMVFWVIVGIGIACMDKTFVDRVR